MPFDQSPSAAAQIVELQRIRLFCIKSQSRCDRSMEALITTQLGYRGDMTEAQRKAVFRQAATIRKSVEKGGEGPDKASTPRQLTPSPPSFP